MKKALQYAKEKGAEIDIISDANTFFINCVLEVSFDHKFDKSNNK